MDNVSKIQGNGDVCACVCIKDIYYLHHVHKGLRYACSESRMSKALSVEAAL